jgi:transglutaminase-like putative cysteine protease
MTGRKGHSLSALAAASIGAATSFIAQGADPVSLLVGAAVLLLGYGRGRGWRLSRLLDRPRFFNIASGLYLPFFFLDLFVTRSTPVAALVRLVLFLLTAELLSGDPRRPYRPVLFGLLLMMGGAAGTTDFWFALPLAAFTVASVTALAGFSLSGETGAAPSRGRVVAVLAAGSLCLGAAVFFVIPRAGTGWGRQVRPVGAEVGLETGLADAVNLGMVGRVKTRTTVAFRGRFDAPASRSRVDLESVYWRAQVYSRWTGAGWERDSDDRGLLLQLPADEVVPFPSWDRRSPPSLVAEIERVRTKPTTMLSSGRPLWLRAERDSLVFGSSDGTLRGVRGRTPRRYEVAFQTAAPISRSLAGKGSLPEAAPLDPSSPLLEAGEQEPEVEVWAASISPGAPSPQGLAAAFVADLSSRPYSLDTTGIDADRPIASFLEGIPAHCEYFASAMAIGLRLRSVPARVVGGYFGADRAPFGRGFVVRDSRAHLWVEAYMPGAGWVEFDPTPPAGRIPLTGRWPTLRSAWDQAVLAWDAWVIGLDLGDQYDLYLTARELFEGAVVWVKGGATWTPWPAAALLVLAVALAVLLLRRRGVLIWTGRARREGIPSFYLRMLRLAARRGLRPDSAETAGEFARRAGEAIGDRAAVALVSRLYERERFGGRPPSPDESGRVEEALSRLAGAGR